MSKKPSFSALNKHCKLKGTHMCTMTFPKTCAIRMSEAIVNAMPKMLDEFKKSKNKRCPHDYMRAAQDLAAVLKTAWGQRSLGFEKPGSAPEGLKGKKGVICYMSIPGFGGQGNIDLWDGAKPVGQAYWDAKIIWFWKL